jgi:hypothetical protein
LWVNVNRKRKPGPGFPGPAGLSQKQIGKDDPLKDRFNVHFDVNLYDPIGHELTFQVTGPRP